MNIPLHVAPIGNNLPPLYFNPGTCIMNGKVVFSPWAIAYFNGESFKYERAGLGEPWIRVE